MLAVIVLPVWHMKSILAWRFGTPPMQAKVIWTTANKVKVDMTYDQVGAVVGIGSYGWPHILDKRIATSSVPVRHSYYIRNGNGPSIDVFFVSNKVVKVEIFEEAANHTSEGIRQPADGLPKPSM